MSNEDFGITYTKSREPLTSPIVVGKRTKMNEKRKNCEKGCGRFIKDDKRMKYCLICQDEKRQEKNRLTSRKRKLAK